MCFTDMYSIEAAEADSRYNIPLSTRACMSYRLINRELLIGLSRSLHTGSQHVSKY